MAGAWKGLRPGFPSGLQVLVIDGAELQDQLMELGYTATMVATAREAAISLSRGQSTPDVLLAEARSVHPGEADSQWLLAQARARHLPLVLMSEGGGPGEVMKGIELGAVDYLEKPVSLPKLRNIWQHVVRKMMASNVDEKPMSYAVPKAQPQQVAHSAAEKAASATDAPMLPSPMVSVDCGSGGGALSGITSHSSKCSEAEASSCSENTKCRRVLRSADTSAESSGKASPSDDSSSAATIAPARLSKLARASSSPAPTHSRGKRSPRAKSDVAAKAIVGSAHPTQQPLAVDTAFAAAAQGGSLAAVSYPASSGMPPAAAWQPSCVWGAPMVPVGWQQAGMPAMFMPVDSSPMVIASPSDGAAGASGKGAAAATPSPASLPSIASFTSAMSCNTELDLPFPTTGDLSAMAAGAVSPSFGSSDNSLHSDFTDLMLPNDLDLDLMFGDGLDGLFGGDAAAVAAAPCLADRPPIGLALRKSQSLVDLINAQLGGQQSGQLVAAVQKVAAASGATPPPCA